MTWTECEVSFTSKLTAALEEAGMVDGRSNSSTTQNKVMFFRDFIDSNKVQSKRSYLIYAFESENTDFYGDNSKLRRNVEATIYLFTTYRPEQSQTINIRKSLETALVNHLLKVRFIESGYDDQSKLYVFEYRIQGLE